MQMQASGMGYQSVVGSPQQQRPLTLETVGESARYLPWKSVLTLSRTCRRLWNTQLLDWKLMMVNQLSALGFEDATTNPERYKRNYQPLNRGELVDIRWMIDHTWDMEYFDFTSHLSFGRNDAKMIKARPNDEWRRVHQRFQRWQGSGGSMLQSPAYTSRRAGVPLAQDVISRRLCQKVAGIAAVVCAVCLGLLFTS
jgi:hypothetical protein